MCAGCTEYDFGVVFACGCQRDWGDVLVWITYVGVANMVPMPRYEAPPVAAALASEIVLQVTPIIASGPRIRRAVARSIKRNVSGNELYRSVVSV